MNFNFEGKSVLVTGSTKGIGYSIAKKFLKAGAMVCINGRNKNNLEKSLKEIKEDNKIGLVADVSIPKESDYLVNECTKAFKKIDILVCNVGSGRSVRPGQESYEEWQKVFAKNFFSTTNIIESCKHKLKETKGSIICISSICGHEVIDNAPITYSTAKAALNFYIKGISRSLGKDGIRINGISPGNILFEGSIWEKKLIEEPDQVKEILRNVPLSKFGSTDDIANFCLWLSSPLSNFCTGSIYRIDGGQLRV